jgi:NADPH:quinone reductase-like Zn-dependent oxidoreductase
MKKVEIGDYGAPEAVAECVEAPDVGPPGPGEVVFDVLAFPINPADIWFCRGNYRLQPTLPATPGAECVGRVGAIGADVVDLHRGDLVINLARENWAQRRRVRAADALPIPAGIDPMQAAMLRINPPTALLLLSDNVDLAPGDWVIQDVANSSVGRAVIVIAKARGLHTVNVVRRADVAAELKALGADVVVEDGADLPQRVRAATGGAPIRLAIDAVAGATCKRLGDCLTEGGLVVNYGSMTGEDPGLNRGAAIWRGVRLGGFGLSIGLERRSPAQVRMLYAGLAEMVRDGRIHSPVDATYPIEQIKQALAHAQRGGRNGKILVLPNGPL